ncbi:MAG: glycoside hydrolase family 127 protein [Bacteroidia bacterium]|nr:glycoside hydrolase family 127 protein [Bacteroidia bacterium]
MKQIASSLLAIVMFSQLCTAQSLRKIEPVSFADVDITDNFWKPRMDKVATTTLQACIYQTEIKTARIRNFEVAAGSREGKFEGIFYDDSDVYKALEAISYSLKNKPNAELEKKADEWIDKITAAQQPDGYLNTYYTLMFPDKRWTDMSMHEDYNGGHLIEGAVAYYNATGKRKLLDVAIKFADYFDSQFGPDKKHWVTGHQELELALVKLYKTTKDEKYLKLADWLLAERGHKRGVGYTWTEWKDTAYTQDLVPVKQQTEITGHAVRAMYLYTGAADVAAQTGDRGYMNAMKTVWDDVVHRNMYITGGIGSSGKNEGFSVDYDLPNEQAYCETCASVGMVFWNQRMNLLTGESKYFDVLERSLYNGALDGLSLSGDRFFYGNPLASTGKHFRREWFGTACCPSNIARLVASLGDYVYNKSADGIWVNLFVESNTKIEIGKTKVAIAQKSNYPWDGEITLSVNPEKKAKFNAYVRIPGWATGEAVPGDLYHFLKAPSSKFSLMVNGKGTEYKMENGYAVINREWRKGDMIQLNLPMEVQEIAAKETIAANVDRVALQRGPLVYCVEGADNDGEAWNILLPENTTFKTSFQKELLNGVVIIKAEVPVITVGSDKQTVSTQRKTITAIPYYSWCNRGSNPMQVWLPRTIKDVKVNY